MKKLFLFFVCILTIPLWAEVSVISVTDETKHTQKEDFYHTFEYYISGEGQNSKCQATRIAPRWFATAAHCVKELCKNVCKIRMDLLDTPVSVFADSVHSTQKPNVFVHPNYSKGQFVKNDFALIRLDLNRASKMYYRRANTKNKNNAAMSEKQFSAWLARNPQARSKYRHALSPQLPSIAVFDNANYVLDRKMSVISIFSGKREVKTDPYPVYYVKELGYAYTQNFGIRKGMSGSGVMTNTGELIGIISAYVGADLYKGKQKIKHQDLFIFPVFNENLVSFMRDTLGSDWKRVDVKEAYPYLVQKTHRNFAEILSIMKTSSQ